MAGLIVIAVFCCLIFYVIIYKKHTKEQMVYEKAEEKKKIGIIEKERIKNTVFFSDIKKIIIDKNIENIKENVLKDMKNNQHPTPKQSMLAYQSVIITPTSLCCYRPIYYTVFEVKYSDLGYTDLSENDILGLSFALADIGHKVVVEPYFDDKTTGASIRIETDFEYWRPYIKQEIDEFYANSTIL